MTRKPQEHAFMPAWAGVVVVVSGACTPLAPPPTPPQPPVGDVPICAGAEDAEDWRTDHLRVECSTAPCLRPINIEQPLEGGRLFFEVTGTLPEGLVALIDGAEVPSRIETVTAEVTVPPGGQPRAITPFRVTIVDAEGGVFLDLPDAAAWVDRPLILSREPRESPRPLAPEFIRPCARVLPVAWTRVFNDNRPFRVEVTPGDPRAEVVDCLELGRPAPLSNVVESCVCLSAGPFEDDGVPVSVPLDVRAIHPETGETCRVDTPPAEFTILPAGVALDDSYGNAGTVLLSTGDTPPRQPPRGAPLRGGMLVLDAVPLWVDAGGAVDALDVVESVRLILGPGRVVAASENTVVAFGDGVRVHMLEEVDGALQRAWTVAESPPLDGSVIDVQVAPDGTVLALSASLVTALTPDGEVRADFSSNGRAALFPAAGEQLVQAAVDDDGRILLLFSSGRVARLTAAGFRDDAFDATVTGGSPTAIAARAGAIWVLTGTTLTRISDEGGVGDVIPMEAAPFLVVDANGRALVPGPSGVLRVSAGGGVEEIGVRDPASVPLACLDDGTCMLGGKNGDETYLARVLP